MVMKKGIIRDVASLRLISGKRKTLIAGRVKVTLLVLRWITRATISLTGDIAVIRPIFPESGGELCSWMMMTRSPF